SSCVAPPPRSPPLPYTTLFRSVGAYPTGLTTVDASLTPATVRGWYNNGWAQNPLALLDYLVVDGQRLISPVLLVANGPPATFQRSEEHTSELQSRENLVCRLLL